MNLGFLIWAPWLPYGTSQYIYIKTLQDYIHNVVYIVEDYIYIVISELHVCFIHLGESNQQSTWTGLDEIWTAIFYKNGRLIGSLGDRVFLSHLFCAKKCCIPPVAPAAAHCEPTLPKP